jgi:large subunit ribosomal protein L22
MRAKATAKYVRGSTRKARLVVEAIKGRSVEEAINLLKFMPQHAAKDVAGVVKSAAANAENNLNLAADELRVVDARADEGPTIKRWRPRARGRVARIRKRTCHITVLLMPAAEGDGTRRRRRQTVAATAAPAAPAETAAAETETTDKPKPKRAPRRKKEATA